MLWKIGGPIAEEIYIHPDPYYIGDPSGEGLMTQSSSPTPSTLAQIKKLL